MNRLLLCGMAVLAFALAQPGRADDPVGGKAMLPNASNAVLPDAAVNLGLDPPVATNIDLASTPTTNRNAVWRYDYAVGHGAPALYFTPQTGKCADNGKVNDGGSCVDTIGGNSWVANPDNGNDPRQFGAKCDIVELSNASMTAGSNVLTVADGVIPASAQGKRVVVTGAGGGPFSVLTRRSSLVSGGTGYAAGDTLTLTGGTFSQAVIVQVLAVDGSGTITNWALQDSGAYTVLPGNPVSQGSSSGGGTGAAFTLAFVGAPLYGTIISADGSASATLSISAGNSRSSARWWYGTDDRTALQAAFNAAKTTGGVPGFVKWPGKGCGTTAQLNLPSTYADVSMIGTGDVVGQSEMMSAAYALAPMQSVMHRTSDFSWYGGVRNMRVNAGYLADYAVYTEGSTQATYRDLILENAKSAGFRCGNGVSGVAGQTLDRIDYRTDPWAFSSKQIPDYGIEMHQFCTDSNIIFPSVQNTRVANLENHGASNNFIVPNVYGAPNVEYCADYGIAFDAGGAILGGQIGCAKLAGVQVNAGRVDIVAPWFNAFSGVQSAKGIVIESGLCDVSVTAAHANQPGQRNENLVVQNGTPCATKGTSVWGNSSATYSTYGNAGTGLASLDVQPADPVGTTSTAAAVMAGLAASITPTKTGNIRVVVTGTMLNDTAAKGGWTSIRYGLGSAPANGDAGTGGRISSLITTSGAGASAQIPFTAVATISGTIGTAYWIDLDQTAYLGGTFSLKHIQIVATEF